MTHISLKGESLVQFISWNTKGLNDAGKRGRVLTHLKKLNADIVFLQETHLRTQDHFRLKKGWVGQLFHSNFHFKSRGAAILISKSTPFVSSHVTADPLGRFVVVTGRLHNVPLILANIYAPNCDDERFFSNLFASLPDLNAHNLIMGGDFNCVLDSRLDRSSSKVQPMTKSAKLIQYFLDTYKVADPWRFKYPSSRSYSFFSPVHHSYSRIDYFLVDSKLLSSVRRCDYEAIVISDHAPHLMQLAFLNKSMPRTWRFNNLLLAEKPFRDFISAQTELFLSINDTGEVSKSTLWEALKAFLRGHIISYSAAANKQRTERIFTITNQIIDIDRRYSASPTPDLYKERLKLQTEFDLLTTNETARQLLQARHRSYEHGEKAGKLLALQIRQSAASRMITEVRTSSGQITADQQDINKEFENFYTRLYSSESVGDTKLFDTFFCGLDIPTISMEDKEQLEAPLSLEELIQSIKSMQSSKAPGPDGFSPEFYKSFATILSPLLLDVLNESFNAKSLPPTFYQACISLLLKRDKDPLDPSSYRPLSLLDVDTKLLAKILAARLEKVLPSIVSQDQTGFIKNRLLFSNIRRLFNIIYSSSSHPRCPEVLISLDAEKAFDRVEWDFLFSTLKRFGFGTTFISWVSLLYVSPSASVQTNTFRSKYFSLHRGTRQGCPLSPLLFALSIEPLAIALRSLGDFQGVLRGEREHKVSLYADDLLLYVRNPHESIPSIMSVLTEFGKVSGYKLNLSKSELFPINKVALDLIYSQFPFKLSVNSFKYLGVVVTRSIFELFKFNFKPLFERAISDFTRWSHLPLSLAGRINIVKMNTLPKFLFLFQCIPILIKKSFFKQLDGEITRFIWDKKPPRIRKDFLQRPKQVGGMALPNFLHYYWACNLRAVSFWGLPPDSDDLPAWLQIERTSCHPTSPGALLFSSLPISSHYAGANPVVKQSLKIWTQIRQHFGWHGNSLLAPLTANHLFHPSLVDSSFRIWAHKGITKMQDLYIHGTFPSFELLRTKFNIPQTHFFRFLQIRNYIRSNTTTFPNAPRSTQMDKLFSVDPSSRGVVSFMYVHLASQIDVSVEYLKSAWEEDLGIHLSEEEWTEAQEGVHSASICTRHGLIQFKVLHRLHLSKVKLSKMYPNIDPVCDRCGLSPASLGHMFWLCPKLFNYWKAIFDTLSEILGVTVELDPVLAVLGVPKDDSPLRRSSSIAARFITLLARRLILLNWKQSHPPSHNGLIKDIMCHLKLEKLRFVLKGSTEKFYKIWQPFLDYVETRQ